MRAHGNVSNIVAIQWRRWTQPGSCRLHKSSIQSEKKLVSHEIAVRNAVKDRFPEVSKTQGFRSKTFKLQVHPATSARGLSRIFCPPLLDRRRRGSQAVKKAGARRAVAQQCRRSRWQRCWTWASAAGTTSCRASPHGATVRAGADGRLDDLANAVIVRRRRPEKLQQALASRNLLNHRL